MASNVVEVVIQAKDQASGVINGVGSNFGKFAVGLTALFAGIKSLGGVISQITEAQASAAQLDAAYKATGATLGRTREQLDDLATSMQQTTTYSDDLVKTAESILLTFDKVRGDAFERTIVAAGDLGARLGTDLPTAVRSLGRALQEPEQGLAALRRAGVTFTDAQVDMVKSFVDTGRAAEAQNFILSEVERRFAGAAAAARNTLGGALTGLKNAFGDLFEGTTKGTSGAVDAVNGLTKALENPKLKGAIDSLISGLAKIAEKVIEVSTGIIGIFTKGVESEREKLEAEIARFEKLLEPKRNRAGIERSSPDDIVLGGGARGVTRESLEKTVESLKKKLAELPAVVTAVGDAATTATGSVAQMSQEMRELMSMDLTPSVLKDRGITNPWIKFVEDQQAMNDEVNASFQDMFNNIGFEAQDAYEKTTNEWNSAADKIKDKTTELSETMKGVWQGVGMSIQGTLSDAIYNSEFSLRSLADIFRRALADISSAIITSGIKNLIADQLDTTGGKGGGGNWISGLLSIFATSAGGGRTDKPTIVGEEGMEIATPTGSGMRTYNARQLAFAAGGGGGISFAPVNNISITGAQNDQAMLQQVQQFVLKTNADSQREMLRLLNRNGYGVRT